MTARPPASSRAIRSGSGRVTTTCGRPVRCSAKHKRTKYNSAPPLSKLALPVVEELASKLKIGVTLFQMTRLIRYYGDGLGGSLHEDEEKQVEGDMIKIETEMKQKGIDVTHWTTVGLDAGDEIIDMSKKTGADLVVMSTHGRSGLGRWLIGSVAEKVLRHGETSLLLVQARAS